MFQDIDMTDNPLGALGMRSLLRLLSRQTSLGSYAAVGNVVLQQPRVARQSGAADRSG